MRWLIYVTICIVYGIAITAEAKDEKMCYNSVKIQGIKNLDIGAILDIAKLKKKACVTSDQLDVALRSILSSRAVSDAKLYVKHDILYFDLEESKSVHKIVFVGNKSFSSSALNKAIHATNGVFSNKESLLEDVRRLEILYRSSGIVGSEIKVYTHPSRNKELHDVIFEIREGRRLHISKIMFIGNTISSNTLRSISGLKDEGIFGAVTNWAMSLIGIGPSYKTSQLAIATETIRRYYKMLGYLDIDVVSSASTRDNGVDIHFIIREGKRYIVNSVDVILNKDLGIHINIEQLKNKLKLSNIVGKNVNSNVLRDSTSRITSYIRKLGLIFYRVDFSTSKQSNRVDIVFKIEKSERLFVRNIEISGNTLTHRHVIMKYLKIASGDPFDIDKLRSGINRLKALRLFSSVEFSVQKSSNSKERDIRIAVIESNTTSVSVGGAISPNAGFALKLSARSGNLFGLGLKSSIKVSQSKNASSGAFMIRRLLDDPSSSVYGSAKYSVISGGNRKRIPTQHEELSAGIDYNVARYMFGTNEMKISQSHSKSDGATSMVEAGFGLRYLKMLNDWDLDNSVSWTMVMHKSIPGISSFDMTRIGMKYNWAWYNRGDNAINIGPGSKWYHKISLGASIVIRSDDLPLPYQYRILTNSNVVRGFSEIGAINSDTKRFIGGDKLFSARYELSHEIAPDLHNVFGFGYCDIASLHSSDAIIKTAKKGVFKDYNNARSSCGVGLKINLGGVNVRAGFATPILEYSGDEFKNFFITFDSK